jgi:hypothetical protein
LSLHTGSSRTLDDQTIARGLERLRARPEWLTHALDPSRVLHALARHVPEVVEGRVLLVDCEIERLVSKDTSGRWSGTYRLTVEDASGARDVLPMRVTLTAPGTATPTGVKKSSARPLGSEGWSCYLPELRLLCEPAPREQTLEAMPLLMDPERARDLLEMSIRAGAPGYADIHIAECRPTMLNYKPGTRCTIRHDLRYEARNRDKAWPDAVIVKAYRKPKGERAYRGMVALWQSRLVQSSTVRIAEPFAYIPTLKVLIQGTLPEDETLEEALRRALRDGSPAALDRLRRLMRATARGLAELHRSGAKSDEVADVGEQIADIDELINRLGVMAPDVAEAAAPFFEHLRELARSERPDPAVPSHGSFDCDQVLIAGDSLGFIDFDSFCMAEPALDVGHFRASLIDSGMKVAERDILDSPARASAYLDKLDDLADEFLARYQSEAHVSNARLALWEGLDYLRDALHLWTKPTRARPDSVVRILERQLRRL